METQLINTIEKHYSDRDSYFMQLAIDQARAAAQINEVPVGAVIVMNDQVIANGFNQPITTSDPSAHAEIVSLRAAALFIKNYRLVGSEIFTTLEPCAMCAGAILQARCKRVVFGAYDEKAGAAGSVVNLFSNQRLNHHTTIHGGISQQTCAKLLQDFFRAKR